MVGIYLSGTGNTKYCIEKLVSLIHSSAKAIPMESPEAISAIQQNEEIYIGYPTQYFLIFPDVSILFIKSRTIYGALENCVGYPMLISSFC